MTITDLEDLYDYSYWANTKLLTHAAIHSVHHRG